MPVDMKYENIARHYVWPLSELKLTQSTDHVTIWKEDTKFCLEMVSVSAGRLIRTMNEF